MALSNRLEQPGAELLEPITGFLARYGRILLGVVGVLVAAGAVTYFAMRARNAAEEQAANQLAEANIFYWQGDYARSGQLAKQVYERYGSTDSGNDAHRLAGDASFWAARLQERDCRVQTVPEHRKNDLLADAARRSLAYALESDHQFLEAAPVYEQLVGKFDRTSSAEFLAASARCYREAGQPAKAIERLQRLTNEFGDSSYAQLALIELAELRATPTAH